MKNIIREIKRLKKEKNAVILVHNYQRPEIYEIADYIGDSFGLSKQATKTKAGTIVFCGVHFMAESAKILNPKKTVLLPDFTAGCPMADMINAEKLRKLKRKHPKAVVACYVNTTAEVKAESDICCTSSNVVQVVNSLPNEEVIIVPDKNLAAYAAKHTNKKIIAWNGYCYVHNKIMYENAVKAKKVHPKAKLVVHPECTSKVTAIADHICSTSGMIPYSKETNSEEIIIATEMGMINRLKKETPNKKFYSLGGICHNMKKNSLQKVKNALQKKQYEIKVPEKIRIKAKKALDKMLEVK